MEAARTGLCSYFNLCHRVSHAVKGLRWVSKFQFVGIRTNSAASLVTFGDALAVDPFHQLPYYQISSFNKLQFLVHHRCTFMPQVPLFVHDSNQIYAKNKYGGVLKQQPPFSNFGSRLNAVIC